MNILLWVLQAALTWFCIAGGVYQMLKVEELKKMTASMRELPRGLWAFFGFCSILAGLGLVLPGIFHVMPVLTPAAAAALCLENIVISGIYVRYGDKAPLPFSAGIAVVAAFVAYGRLLLAPL
jgi:hypothetical protein